MKNDKGFTLIELIIVSVIIATLAAIGSVYYYKSVERGRAAEAYATLALIADAQNIRRAQAGAYSALWGDMETFNGAPRSLNFQYVLNGGNYAVAKRIRAKNSYFMCFGTGRRGACVNADDCPVPNCGLTTVIPLY